jgi:hypothetical protein
VVTNFSGNLRDNEVFPTATPDCNNRPEFRNKFKDFGVGGFNVCTETGMFNGSTLSRGTYWLELQKAVSAEGNPVYWDENNGVGCHSVGCPSIAFDSSIGSIPSEAFSMLGSQSGTGTTPEPTSLALFASGALGVVGWIRRYGASD